MSDLIERLKEVRDLWESPNDPPEWDRPIQEAIAALFPALPDDVAESIGQLRTAAEVLPECEFWTEGEWCASAADLLERQARNYESACRLMEMKDDDRDKLQQRIEELEAAIKEAVSALYEGRYPEDPDPPEKVFIDALAELEKSLSRAALQESE